MKIAFLIHNLSSGGSERATCALANFFYCNNNDVTIITIDGSASFYPLEEGITKIFLNMPAIPKGSPVKKVIAILKRFLAIRKNVKAFSPQVLIGMSHIMSFYAVSATMFTKTKSIGTERSNPYIYQNSKPFSLLRRLTSRLADGFVHQTKRASEFFPKNTMKKSIVIPNAVFNPLVSNIKQPFIREKTITAMGRLNYAKGFDILIDAFSRIEDQIKDYKLVIYGEGDEKESIEKLIKVKNLTDRVELPGAVPDAIINISKSSLFVLSSRFEGMPNALMEAMACGVPCISTKCPMGPEELIEDGVNGLLVPVEDAESIANAIIEVIMNKDFADKLSKNAYQIRNTHSVGSIGQQWLDYFQVVIGKADKYQ